jgi:D-arabinose 1-dehydrogenase-like Zn-dependent alcohol dehydrogenase
MRAARLHEFTHDMESAFTIEDRPRPEVTRSDHVVVDVEGAGWCQTDNHVVEGEWQEYIPIQLPHTPGHENAGTVAEVGEEVTLVEPGDQVICHPVMTCGTCRACRQGQDMYCEDIGFSGMTHDGGFAEELLTTERAVIPLDSVDPVDIAPHADAGITAYHAAKKARDELVPGDTALVVGVGGLGHIGLQALDAMTAADIVAVDPKREARDLAERLGASETIDPGSEDVAEVVAALTDDRGVAQTLDFVGADDTLGYAGDVLAAGGDHHVVGYGGHVHEPAQALVDGEFSFRGTLVGTYTELQELVALVEGGEVDLVTTEYDLEAINEVAAKLQRGEIEGRAVITP